MRYVIFSKPACPYCEEAIDILKNKSLSFHTVNFNEDQTSILQEIKAAASWKTVPMIFEIGKNASMKFIGGCSELKEHLGV
jgi:glutaredoxin